MVFLFCGISFTAENKAAQKQQDEKDYCVSCHEAQETPSLKEPVTRWKSGVHAGEGMKCSLCHGGDPGVNDKLKAKSKLTNYTGKPDKKKIPGFCGREGCHAAALDQFRRGPHNGSVQKTGDPGCVFCHGAHDIQRTSVDVITAQSCASCHPADYSKEIVTMIGDIDRSIAGIDAGIKGLLDKEADVTGMKDRLNNARRLFHQMVHVFSRDDMQSSRKIIEVEIKSLESEARSKTASIQRLDILYVTMAVFGLAIIFGMILYVMIMYSRRKK